MIIIEFFKDLAWLVGRFFVWIITARDCNHCKHYKREILFGYICQKRTEEMLDCLDSIKRKYFERESEDSNESN